MYVHQWFYTEKLNQDFEMCPYLKEIVNRNLRNALSRLRQSSHQLTIESGRHRGIERQNRKCTLCTTNDIEDEYHMVLICPRYQSLRR